VRQSLVVGLCLLAAPAAAGRIPITCSPDYGAGGSFGFQALGHDVEIVDGFPECREGPVWSELRDASSLDGATYAANARAAADEGAQDLTLGLELVLEEDAWGMVWSGFEAEGTFDAPQAPMTVPAEIVLWIQRTGSEGLLDLTASVAGPGVQWGPDLASLPDGAYTFPLELQPGATYATWLSASGTLVGESGAGSAHLRLAVDSPLPEPSEPLLLMAGALLLAGRASLGRGPRFTGGGPASPTSRRLGVTWSQLISEAVNRRSRSA
jgi:hypothetical protein